MTRNGSPERAGATTRARTAAARLRMISAQLGMVAASTAINALVGYLVLEYLRIPGSANVLWWPAAAMTIVVMVRSPQRWWIAMLIGMFIAPLLINHLYMDWVTAISYAIVSVIEAVVAVSLLVDRATGTRRRLRTPAEGVRFVLAILAAVAVGGVLISVRALIFPVGQPWDVVARDFVTRHLIGLLAFAPLLLPAGAPAGRGSVRNHLESIAIMIAAVGIGLWAFASPIAPGRAFPVLLPVVWAAIRLDSIRATVVTLTSIVIATYGTARGRGVFAEIENVAEREFMTQLFSATVAVTGLALVLVTRHREHLADQARAGEKTMRRAIRDSLVPMYAIQLGAENFGEIRDANKALASMLGYQREELEGKHCAILGAGDDPERLALLDTYLTQLRDGAIGSYREESQFATAGGGSLWVETNVSRVHPVTGPPFALVHVHDLTQRQQNKQQLEQMALHDALTGLANRALLFTRLHEAFAQVGNAELLVGLLYLDLDGFKEINDTYGHAAGDAVLVEVAARLSGAVRPGDTVARLGGDEFAVVCASLRSAADLDHIAERVRIDLAPAIELPTGTSVIIHASIGAAVAGAEGDPDQLIRAADTKMYETKRARRAVVAPAQG